MAAGATPSPSNALSPVAALVRRVDPDRFFTALFAPPDRREALFTLYAFNYETARAHEATTEPMMALIRLQWWREVVEGQRKSHEVATPLAGLLHAGALDPAELLAMLDARERTEFATLADWREWLLGGAGSLALAAARLLGAPGAAAVLRLGAGYGAAGVLRSVAAAARGKLCLLPADVLAAHGLDADAVIAAPQSPALQPVFRALAAEGLALLGARHRPGPALAAALPAALARRDLRHPGDPAPRGFPDRMAVTLAAMTGRV